MPTDAPSPPLFPACVARHSLALDPSRVAEPTREFPDVSLPQELLRAVPKRQAEYLAGRYCARAAILQLAPERAGEPIGVGANRAPIWPAGLVGSITHTAGFVSAAVARRAEVRALGLDTERVMSTETAEQVGRMLATPSELARVAGASGLERTAALTLIFSAKESVFKCLYPLVGRYFDFLDAEVTTADLAAGRFEARLVVDLTAELAAGYPLHGRLARVDAWIHTGLALTEPGG